MQARLVSLQEQAETQADNLMAVELAALALHRHLDHIKAALVTYPAVAPAERITEILHRVPASVAQAVVAVVVSLGRH
jgi:phage terminase Nu1 subunit (DNA packaging protein)